MNDIVKFSDLLPGAFFGTSDINCYSSTIFVKVNDGLALSVWDRMYQEAKGRLIEVDKDTPIRETYEATFVDEQSKNPQEHTFKVKTATGHIGTTRKQETLLVGKRFK